MSYKRFLLMIITSMVVMYMAMYLNNYAWDHIFWSETRAYMVLIMGAIMAVVMLLFMIDKYPNKKANTLIFIGSAVLFASSLFLVRSQITVGDVAWMKGMIPHHSIAILTSKRAHIKDPRVRQLADDIIAAQEREIEEMKRYIKDLKSTKEKPMSLNIEHNQQTNRFEVHIDGYIGYLEYEEKDNNVLDFTHTIVPKELGGRGVGSSLVKHGLDYAREHGYKVIPTCSFVEAYINKREDYLPLLA